MHYFLYRGKKIAMMRILEIFIPFRYSKKNVMYDLSIFQVTLKNDKSTNMIKEKIWKMSISKINNSYYISLPFLMVQYNSIVATIVWTAPKGTYDLSKFCHLGWVCKIFVEGDTNLKRSNIDVEIGGKGHVDSFLLLFHSSTTFTVFGKGLK